MDSEIESGWKYTKFPELDCLYRFEHVPKQLLDAAEQLQNDKLYAVETLVPILAGEQPKYVHKKTYFMLGIFAACAFLRKAEKELHAEIPLLIRPATDIEIKIHQAAGKRISELNVDAISDEEL